MFGKFKSKDINKNNGKRKALIIAVSEYDKLSPEKQLPFCKNDGEAIYEILKKQGYEISDNFKLIGKVEGDTIKKSLINFFRRNNVQPDDTLVFYFSGHGFPDAYGGHFLGTSNIDVDIPEEYGYRFSDLEDITRKSRSNKIITILDCCFSGAAEAPGAKGTEQDIAKSASAEMDQIFEGDGKCVLASSLGNQSSYQMKDQPFSTFTFFVINGLTGASGESADEEGDVTTNTLGDYVYKKMLEDSARQKPIRKSTISKDIVIAHYPDLVSNQNRNMQLVIDNVNAINNKQKNLRDIIDQNKRNESNDLEYPSGYLSISDLYYGILLSMPVCRIRIDGKSKWLATGFMISSSLMITCGYVLPSIEVAKQAFVDFNFDDKSNIHLQTIKTFSTDTDRFFYTNYDEYKNDGISLTAIKPRSTDDTLLDIFGFIPLRKNALKRIGSNLSIIHQPRGGQKFVSLKNFIMLDFNKDSFKYSPAAINIETTQAGSAGSPIFNENWDLIGMHNLKLPETNKNITITQGIIIDRIINYIETCSNQFAGEKRKLFDQILL